MTLSQEDRARLRKQRSEQAIQLAIQNRWEEAAALNQQIVVLFPRDTDAWNRLGKALSELGRTEEARQAYSKTIELDPVNQIARKNLQRLASLGPEQQPVGAPKLEPHMLIEETGKTGQTMLLRPNMDVLKTMAPGEQVNLTPVGGTLTVTTVRGEQLGDVEPKLGLRLVRLMEAGNQYQAWLTSFEGGGRLLLKETLQHPSQAGKPSFPPAGTEGFRSYTKESLLRYDLEDEERGVEEPAEEWVEPEAVEGEVAARRGGGGGDTEISLFQLAAEEKESDEEEFEE